MIMETMYEKFKELKTKYPNRLLLFRVGESYEAYQQDAENAAEVLGITLTTSSKALDNEGKRIYMTMFSWHALDIYLPKLIRSGYIVAICDSIYPTKTIKKRCITELPVPSK